ncbi:MAG: SPFH domain-containing protein [Lactobacillaceae bacterium]|jgi:membrane protease subunit (stomatin/prohibitin family)|nr:SPFH domain-containing protein [Lactobacillaceae bacterium]
MGIIKAFAGSITGSFADQWTDIITVGTFGERTAVMPGILQQSLSRRGTKNQATPGVISNGSKIFVPENTAAFIFSQSGIEDIITEAGGYTYENGQEGVFDHKNDEKFSSLLNQIGDRLAYGGQTPDQKRIAFVNLREIRGIKFGTKRPVIYNDVFYGTDLEILSFGNYSIKIVDPTVFIRNYLPANAILFSFDSPVDHPQITAEFLQSYIDAINTLSNQYRVSQLPAQADGIVENIKLEDSNAGTWKERFGFEIVSVGIENIELSPDSKELVKKYSGNKMNLSAFENISQKASNISAQQNISQGIKDHGLGDGGGMLFGMNMAQALNPQNAIQAEQKATTADDQIETLMKFKKLLDDGILNQAEFDLKKKEILSL